MRSVITFHALFVFPVWSRNVQQEGGFIRLTAQSADR